jgi:hypothetical protein
MPPLLRLAWKMGIRIPPLPFARFWQVALLMGIPIVLYLGYTDVVLHGRDRGWIN